MRPSEGTKLTTEPPSPTNILCTHIDIYTIHNTRQKYKSKLFSNLSLWCIRKKTLTFLQQLILLNSFSNTSILGILVTSGKPVISLNLIIKLRQINSRKVTAFLIFSDITKLLIEILTLAEIMITDSSVFKLHPQSIANELHIWRRNLGFWEISINNLCLSKNKHTPKTIITLSLWSNFFPYESLGKGTMLSFSSKHYQNRPQVAFNPFIGEKNFGKRVSNGELF